MKRTKRTLTLRGSHEFPVASTFDFEQILDYANVLDIKMGWKVRDYEVMVQNPNLGSAFVREDFSLETILATDVLDSGWAGGDPRQDMSDNRQIAWGNQLYACGMSPTANVFGMRQTHEIVDPDHLVQNQLNIGFRVCADPAVVEGVNVTVNWIVYLDEYNITPSESIVFNIKGQAQDVD